MMVLYDEPNYRNGTKSKRVRSKYGEFEVDTPQDKQSSFDPIILPKRKKTYPPLTIRSFLCMARG